MQAYPYIDLACVKASAWRRYPTITSQPTPNSFDKLSPAGQLIVPYAIPRVSGYHVYALLELVDVCLECQQRSFELVPAPPQLDGLGVRRARQRLFNPYERVVQRGCRLKRSLYLLPDERVRVHLDIGRYWILLDGEWLAGIYRYSLIIIASVLFSYHQDHCCILVSRRERAELFAVWNCDNLMN